MSQAAQQQLKDVLGISLARAATLLRETGGSIEDAISLHFAAVPLSVPRSPRSELRTLLGDDVTVHQAQRLLSQAGTVAAAADLYFENPAAAGPPGVNPRTMQTARGPPPAAQGRRQPVGSRGGRRQPAGSRGGRSRSVRSSPVVEDDEDDTSEEEGEEEEEENAEGEEEEEEGEEEEEEEEDQQDAAAVAQPARRPTARAGRSGSAGRSAGSGAGRGRGRAEGGVHLPLHQPLNGMRLAEYIDLAASISRAGSAPGSHGLVRSPQRRGGAAGAVIGQLLARLAGGGVFGGGRYSSDEMMLDESEDGYSDSDGYGEEEDAPASPRLGPPVTDPTPELNEAAAAWAEQRALRHLQRADGGQAGCDPDVAPAAPPPSPPPDPAQLPLPGLRRGGRLFTERQEDVPSAAAPQAELRFPLALGSVELPLATLDEAGLRGLEAGTKRRWQDLRWGAKSHLFHDYLGPSAYRNLAWSIAVAQRAMPLDELAAMGYPASHLGLTARLALFGIGPQDEQPLATVREDQSWVAELIYSLWVLETAQVVQVRCRLVEGQQPAAEQQQQQQQQPEQQQQQQQPEQQQQQQQQQSEGSPAPEQQADAAGPSGGGAGRRRSRWGPMHGAQAAHKPAAASAAAAAPGVQPSGSGSGRSGGHGVPPRGVRVEVLLTDALKWKLWWDGDNGDLTEQMEGKGRKGAGVQKQGWTKNGAALANVVACLLRYGTGLGLGPDSDGLLNLGDVAAAEWGEVAAAASRRRLFDVNALLDSVAYKRSGPPRAQAPRGLATQPKQYQLAGLGWMMDRETKGDALGRGQLHLHPAWLQLRCQDGQLLHLHRLRPHLASPKFYPAPVGGTCGGFLVDEMGLGKTLQTLMLVLSNPAPRGWAVSKLEGQSVSADSEPVPIKCSLVVVPANLMGQWAEEIERHVLPGTFKWCRYLPPGAAAAAAASAEADEAAEGGATRRSRRVAMAGNAVDLSRGSPVRPIMCRAPDGSLLAMHQADLVLMSYEQLRDQLHAAAGQSSLLHQYGFWRVVLDEAQLVANSSSVAAVVASSLWRRHAWVVTGTPISQRLEEIKGLLEFLAAEPYHHSPVWRGLLQHEYEAQRPGGLLALRALLRGVMLRRSKADVAQELELPPHSREDRWVALSSVERLVYEQSRRTFCDAAYQLVQQQGAAAATGRIRTAGKATGRALAALTALRQSCCHPQIVRRTEEALGKERKSMRDIMSSLVVKAYSEWDQAARRLLDARLIAAAVEAGVGSHPEDGLRPLLELIQANQAAAAATDIRHASTAVRGMFAEVDAAALPAPPPAAAADGQPGTSAAAAADGGAGPSGPSAALAARAGNGEQPALAPDDKGKGPVSGELSVAQEQPGQQGGASVQQQQQQQQQPEQQQQQQTGRKRSREESEGQQERQQRQQQQQQQAGGAPHAADAQEGDRQLAEALQAEEDAQQAQQQPELSEEERQAEKEGAARARQWRRLELDARELWCHMLRQCAAGKRAPVKGKPKSPDPPAAKRPRRRATAAAADPDEAAAAAQQPDKAALQAQLEESLKELEGLREQLNVQDGGVADGRMMRRSRRKAGIDADDDEAEVFIDVKEAEEQLLNAKLILRAYNECLGRRDPGKSARTAVAAAEKECREGWHHLQHMLNKERSLLAAEKGKAGAEAGEDGGDGEAAAGPPGAAAEQADLASCPICLDELSSRTITACGHHYCPPCIREVLAHGTRLCPICRTPLSESDLFDAVSEEEARLNAAAREAAAAAGTNADYGAKVSALLSELAAMRASDPGAKAVVFSSWGRLLRLAGAALSDAGLGHASLAGASPAEREAALHSFLHDPACAVLTVMMSTAGGAAGLTLTVATTAFILEPSLNPGVESQAAARIWRLGQSKPTRVVRLLAERSVEGEVLEAQRRKLESGEVPSETPLAEADAGLIISIYEAVK